MARLLRMRAVAAEVRSIEPLMVRRRDSAVSNHRAAMQAAWFDMACRRIVLGLK